MAVAVCLEPQYGYWPVPCIPIALCGRHYVFEYP